MGEHNIVFEDLHGDNEPKPITVDLDVDAKDDGIKRTPTEQVVADNAGNDDDTVLDGLRSADAADEPPTKKDAASSDNEDDDYSKKVKARIQRATRATTKERDRGNYWENEARRLGKETADREKLDATKTVERADTQIATTLSQLDSAIEAGNTKDQVRLTDELTDHKAAKARAEVTLENLSPDGNVQPFSGKVDDSASPSENVEADKWRKERGDWYGAAGFESQTRLANRLDKEVFADGYDPNKADYFIELDRRIKAKQPKLYDNLEDDTDDVIDDKPDNKRRKSPVAPVDSGDSRRQHSSSSKVELGEEDFANMRRFNLDPNDPEVLKEYARNKREAEAGEKQ